MKRSKLYSFMNDRYPSDTTAPQPDTPQDELPKCYNNSPCIPEQNDPLRYWGVHVEILPLLTQLALRHLVVPASSAAVERLFSVGGILQTTALQIIRQNIRGAYVHQKQ